MDLHTDGTYVKEVTDWLLMAKINEQNVEGGETAMLHLDDWEHCDDLFINKSSQCSQSSRCNIAVSPPSTFCSLILAINSQSVTSFTYVPSV